MSKRNETFEFGAFHITTSFHCDIMLWIDSIVFRDTYVVYVVVDDIIHKYSRLLNGFAAGDHDYLYLSS